MNIVGFIPARKGSKRIPDKNIKELNGIPLFQYTVTAAKEAKVFEKDGDMEIYLCSDSDDYCRMARDLGIKAILSKSEIRGDLDPDLLWIQHALEYLRKQSRVFDFFAILRATNPFKTGEQIAQMAQLLQSTGADSIRAVRPCKEHPLKMWSRTDQGMIPFVHTNTINGVEAYNCATQLLPELFIQAAAMEMGKTSNVTGMGSVSGRVIRPFFLDEVSAFDINTPFDFTVAE